MSTSGSRAGPNSSSVRNMNSIKPEGSADDSPSLDEELSLDAAAAFMNTAFLDMELGLDADFLASPIGIGAEVAQPPCEGHSLTTPAIGDLSGLGFITADLAGVSTSPDLIPPSTAFYGVPDPRHYYQQTAPQMTGNGPSSALNDATQGTSPGVWGPTVDEDKRRRNTAASARFRMKKKQRDQALEHSFQDNSEKVIALENRLQELEAENVMLRDFLLEKDGAEKRLEVLSKLSSAQQEEKAASKETKPESTKPEISPK